MTVCAAPSCVTEIHATGRKRFCSRACQSRSRYATEPAPQPTDSPQERPRCATGRWFGVCCLDCGSDVLTLTAKVAEHRSTATHQAQILTCGCGLEMLLAVDLSRVTYTPLPSRSAA